MNLSAASLREFSARAEASAGAGFFEGFTEDDLNALADRLEGVALIGGEALGVGGTLWLVLEGTVVVQHVCAGQLPVDLGPLGPGSFFGHLGLLLAIEEPTIATALGPAVCARMGAVALQRWTESGELAAVKFHRLLARCMVRALRSANGRLADLAARPELREYARRRGVVG